MAKQMLWDYAELYVQYIEQRGTAQANATKLAQSRKETLEATALATKLNDKNAAIISKLRKKLKDLETSKEKSRNRETTSGRPRAAHEKSRDSSAESSSSSQLDLKEEDENGVEAEISPPPPKKARTEDQTDQRTVFYTVKGYARSESEQTSKSKAEGSRLSRFKPRKLSNQGSANKQMIAYVMDYSDYVKRFDPEREEAWTELGEEAPLRDGKGEAGRASITLSATIASRAMEILDNIPHVLAKTAEQSSRDPKIPRTVAPPT